jgi:excisionase family DNA binding protein
MKRETTLTPHQAAQRLHVGMSRLYALLYSGKLRASKHGNRWVVPESAVAERQRQVEGFQRLQGASAYHSEARNA